MVSMLFVIISIAIFVLETHNGFRVLKNDTSITASDVIPANSDENSCCGGAFSNRNPSNYTKDDTEAHPAITYMDYVCFGYFTLEVTVRFIFAPNKLRFFKQPLNVIDVICILPYMVSLILKRFVANSTSIAFVLKNIVVLRVIRILRIFKLMKHYSAFKILVYTIKVSTKELGLMIVFLFCGTLIFASLIFFVENETFDNIPIGFWWALVTMTTVGYGDKYPKKESGYVIGVACVICGVLTIAFTVPIVVNNFTLYYSHAQSRTRIKIAKKRKRLMSVSPMKGVSSPSPTDNMLPPDQPVTVMLPPHEDQLRKMEEKVKNNLNVPVDKPDPKQAVKFNETTNKSRDKRLFGNKQVKVTEQSLQDIEEMSLMNTHVAQRSKVGKLH